MTAVQVIAHLRAHHARLTGAPAIIEELRTGTAFQSDAERRIDLFVMLTWPSANFHRTAYEVKVSRSDFWTEFGGAGKRDEAKAREKHVNALRYSNAFSYAVPAGLVTVDEVPEWAGLTYIHEDGRVKVVKVAPERSAEIPATLLAAVLRRLHHTEARQEPESRKLLEAAVEAVSNLRFSASDYMKHAGVLKCLPERFFGEIEDTGDWGRTDRERDAKLLRASVIPIMSEALKEARRISHVASLPAPQPAPEQGEGRG